MPIYAYRCETCGHAKDVLQKLSDPLLSTCPACGAETFRKQVTAAGFQLKGSGWYVTDFRGGDTGKGKAAADAEGAPAKPAETGATPAAGATQAAPAAAPAPAASDSSKPAAAPPPASAPPSSS